MNTLTSRTRIMLISFALTILSACGGGGGGGDATTNVPTGNQPIKITAITITPQNPWVSKGGNPVQLTATFTPTNAANKAIAWASSNTAAISVSTMGLVTANVDTGSVTITATAQDGSQIRSSTTVTAVPPCSTAMPCLYVTSTTSGNGDGTSWASPLPGLQAALEKASQQLGQTTSNKPNAVRILLQNGIYRPSKKADGTACVVDTTYSDCSFGMQNNVEIYGGFAGTETSLADRVLNTATTTYLDGLLNPSATVTACAIGNVNAQCSLIVITNNYTAIAPLTASAILDGVVVRNGRSPDGFGGGMYNFYASPTIRNATFSGNAANSGGGGMYNSSSSPLLTNVTFSSNAARLGLGGGMFNAISSPILTNVTFSGNAANSCGGMYNSLSSPILINGTFFGNSATTSGSKNACNDANSLPIFVNTLVWGDGIVNYSNSSYAAYFSLIQGVGADTNGNVDGVKATTAGIFGNAAPALADNGNPLAQTFAIDANGQAASKGALVWKSGRDYYVSKGNDIFVISTGVDRTTAIPAGATLISTGGANKNNTLTPTAGPPAVYPDLGAYQH